jgi:hypothetical protein
MQWESVPKARSRKSRRSRKDRSPRVLRRVWRTTIAMTMMPNEGGYDLERPLSDSAHRRDSVAQTRVNTYTQVQRP